jgi:hypothetical protein
MMLAFCNIWASGAKGAKAAEASALLDKADELSSLTANSTAPFTLRATVAYQYEGAPKSSDATLLLQWSDETHWRATVADGQRQEVYVRNAEGMWLPKLPDPVLFPALAYGLTLALKPDLMRWDEEIRGVRARTIQGTTFSCVVLRRKMVEQEVCVDPATDLPRWTSVTQPAAPCFAVTCAQAAAITEYRDYAKFGTKWLPREVITMLHGSVANDLRLVGVEFATSLPSDLFADPPKSDYDVWPACTRYRPVQLLPGPIHVLRGLSMGPADAILIIVRPGAKTPEARLVHPSGRNPAEFVRIFTDLRYQVASCDGNPVAGFLFLPLSDSGLPYRGFPYAGFSIPLRY